MSDGDIYETRLAAWKAKHGLPNGSAAEIDGEAQMVAEDAKRKGKCYCGLCAEQFPISSMCLVTRRDDPFIQFDEDPCSNRPDWYIQVPHRIRMCLPCYKQEYDDDPEAVSDTPDEVQSVPCSGTPK